MTKKAAKKVVKKVKKIDGWSVAGGPVLRPLLGSISHEKNIIGHRMEFFTEFDSKDDVDGPIQPGGCLATPNEMDINSIIVTLADYTGDENTVLLLASKAKIRWILAGSTIWYSSKLSDGVYNSETKQFVFDINSPIDAKPRKFLPNELFKVVLENLMPELWRRIRVAFHGTLYVPL